jgi:FkbM family methyltransferase
MSIKRFRRILRMHQRRLEGRLRRRLFGDHVAAAIIRSGSGVYAIDIEDDAVRRKAQAYKSPVEDEIHRVAQFVDQDSDVLVVGAHIGTVAIPVSRLCRKLWAIEANPRTFELLMLNLKLNDATNVHALNIMAGERDEEAGFVLNRTNSGGSKRMPKVKASMYFADHPDIVTLKTRALDEVLPDIDFALVFMDIEGSEYFALKGMQKILGRARTLFVEFLPHHLRNVSGVSPEEFVTLIAPHFSRLFIPSKNQTVARSAFKETLRRMYDHDEADAGLVFTR